jgi:hypothetical protein
MYKLPAAVACTTETIGPLVGPLAACGSGKYSRPPAGKNIPVFATAAAPELVILTKQSAVATNLTNVNRVSIRADDAEVALKETA